MVVAEQTKQYFDTDKKTIFFPKSKTPTSGQLKKHEMIMMKNCVY